MLKYPGTPSVALCTTTMVLVVLLLSPWPSDGGAAASAADCAAAGTTTRSLPSTAFVDAICHCPSTASTAA